MAIKKYNLTPQQIAVDSCETPREYYYKIYHAKQDQESWAMNIPCDSIIYFADHNEFDKIRMLEEDFKKEA